MAVKPAIHGRDHCPGGADPIPCLPGAYAWISSQLNQTSALVPDDARGFDISPPTDGFSSDPNILEPTATGLAGIIVKQPGYLVATVAVIGWRNYTGPGTQVLDSVKGCGVLWDLGDISGKTAVPVNFASSVSGGANIGDVSTIETDSGIVTASNRRVAAQVIHTATVNAGFDQLDLYVTWVGAYPGSGQTYTFP